MAKLFFFLTTLFFSFTISAQQIELLSENHQTSLRGLCVVNDNIVWVSGNNGQVGKSLDAGKTWQWITVKNFEKSDFRDIEAFDEKKALIMAVSEPAYILKTVDGGEHWNVVFTDSTRGMFLDAMDFGDDAHGVVIGDPINGKIFLAHTETQGDSWTIDKETFNMADGETFFAASGTNVKMFWDKKVNIGDLFLVTGGKKSRIFANDTPRDLNIIHGATSQGANSIAIDTATGKFIIVGGDFSKDSISKDNCTLFSVRRNAFEKPLKPPYGYKSCVEFITSTRVISCGTSGVDISENGGKNWRHISPLSFHVCKRGKTGKNVFLAGINGKIGHLNW